ncbi:MAG: restriction endonuclease subunit M [Agathobacter sp.]|nr:restriction endonuclease subunit M [Agathobacter sp.]
MEKIIDLTAYPVKDMLGALLKDKTTKKNIIFATDAYNFFDETLSVKSQITEKVLMGFNAYVIQPRVYKSQEEQLERTRKKAEVFTPSWICNKMNNHCDEEWFGRKDVFNREIEQGWETNYEPITFDENKTWQQYVESNRLEITCGEAPYIVSRYDAATGEIIPVKDRIGILDRKLRVVNENTDNKEAWLSWVYKAYQSVYGFEYQGDNLLIARINLLVSFVDYMKERWECEPSNAELRKIVNIICWNIWQMDGITGTVPYGTPKEDFTQISFFDFIEGITPEEEEDLDCRIYDWKANRSILYRSLKEGR